MNSIAKYIVLGAVAVFGATSCLDLDPKDQLADPDMWNKQSDFVNFGNKFYDWLPSFTQVYDGNIHADMRSDLLRGKDATNIFSNGSYTPGSSDSDYTGAYSHIRRCCLLLERAEAYANPAEICQPVGEAYFFRAYSYFGLVQKFGDVILVKNTIDTDDALMKAARNDRSEVIDFVIEDLEKAIENLKSVSDVEDGRISREGAQAYLSRVALYEGTWQKFRGNDERGRQLLDIAAKAAKAVIDSRKFEIFAPASLGTEAYKYMFILENTKCNAAGLQKAANKEYIIKRCYDEALKPSGQNLTTTALNNAWFATAKLADMYLCSDGLPVTVSKKFEGYNTVKSEWNNRDNRMSNTLMRPGDMFWNNSKNNCRIDWSGSEAEQKRAKYTDFTPGNGSRYALQKWATERECTDRNESYDFPVLRYAEVLLNYAEAVYERDGAITDDDLNISLNLTRRRVNPNMPVLSNKLAADNGLDMREEIRRERTVELFQEGFRIDDLKRWKTAEKEMSEDMLGVMWVGEWQSKMANHGGYDLNKDNRIIIDANRTFTEKHYLYPLPIDQQQLNPNIGQNPGWPAAAGN